MALPNSITNTTPAGSDLPSTIDNQIRDLKLAVQDILGIPNATSISAAGLNYVAAGLDRVIFQDAAGSPSAAGRFQRNGTNLEFHDGTAARIIANAVNTLTLTNKTLTAPTISDPAITGGTISDPAITGGTITQVPITQNSQSAAYTTVLADGGKHLLHPSADNNARTFTIDSNANVAYPTGTAITFVNQINVLSIVITADTLTLAGTSTTGTRTLAVNGIATALKVASTSWIISGTGLA